MRTIEGTAFERLTTKESQWSTGESMGRTTFVLFSQKLESHQGGHGHGPFEKSMSLRPRPGTPISGLVLALYQLSTHRYALANSTRPLPSLGTAHGRIQAMLVVVSGS